MCYLVFSHFGISLFRFTSKQLIKDDECPVFSKEDVQRARTLLTDNEGRFSEKDDVVYTGLTISLMSHPPHISELPKYLEPMTRAKDSIDPEVYQHDVERERGFGGKSSGV